MQKLPDPAERFLEEERHKLVRRTNAETSTLSTSSTGPGGDVEGGSLFYSLAVPPLLDLILGSDEYWKRED